MAELLRTEHLARRAQLYNATLCSLSSAGVGSYKGRRLRFGSLNLGPILRAGARCHDECPPRRGDLSFFRGATSDAEDPATPTKLLLMVNVRETLCRYVWQLNGSELTWEDP